MAAAAVAGPVAGTTGMSFDGAPCSGINLDAGASTLAPAQVTVEAWLQPTYGRYGIAFRWRLFGYALVGGDTSFGGAPENFAVYNSAQFGTASDARLFNDGAWHYVVGTYDSQNVKIYVDGVLGTSVPTSGPIYYVSGGGTAIGRDGDACDGRLPSFRGNVAQVAVYDHALTAAQIAAHASAAPSAGPSATPSLSSSPVNGCLSANPPQVVVVVARGLTSSLDMPSNEQPYDPLEQDQCNALSSKNAALHSLGLEFDTTTQDFPGPTLMDSIAKTGALILPFSYNGAYFINTSSCTFSFLGCPKPQSPQFWVNSYSGRDTFTDVIKNAWLLDQELMSIRQLWPDAKIVLIGHSEGGLIMKQWWEYWDGHHDGAPDHASTNWNVAGVFTLDSPINGGPGSTAFCEMSTLAVPELQGLCLEPQALGLFGEYAALWFQGALIDKNDSVVAKAAVGDRANFTPIGTRGDLVMELLSWDNSFNPFNSGQELRPQLLAEFDAGGYITTLLEPGRITPTVAGSAIGDIWSEVTDNRQFPSHQVVYHDPDNIRFLTGVVSAAAAGLHPFEPGALRTQLLPAGPTGKPKTQVAIGGGTFAIGGSGLGSDLGSILLLSGSSTPQKLTVVSWSGDTVIVKAPPATTEGIVVGKTATGIPFLAGPLIILSSAGPTWHLQVDPLPIAVDGQPVDLVAHVSDGAGHPVRNVAVNATDGLAVYGGQSDSSGRATISVNGVGNQSLIVFVGSAYAIAPVTRSRLPPRVISLAVDSPRPPAGQAISVSVTVRDGDGRPVPGVSVTLSVVGPARPLLVGSSTILTDANGQAVARVAPRQPGSAVISAVTPSAVRGSGMVVDWQNSNELGNQTTRGGLVIVGLLVVAVVGWAFARRRWRSSATMSGRSRDQDNR